MKRKYWVAVVSKEHIERGIAEKFIQVCHGKQAPLKRMRKGDYVVVYSSKVKMEGKEKCRSFTALGKVTEDEIYRFQMNENFIPFRRSVEYVDIREQSILPLINELEFITDKTRWGFPFRYGFFEINEHDFNLITSKMVKYEID